MPFYQGVLLDVDGTLVDSNDAHARSWVRAFRDHGFDVAFDDVFAKIGKGGDKLVRELVGLDEDDPKAKAISEDREGIFSRDELPEIQAFPKARELLAEMKARGLKLVVASSAKRDELEKLLTIVGAKGLIEGTTSSDDAAKSKPDPHIVEAAARAGVAVIAFRCGGWDDDALGGAITIYDGPADLLDRYSASPLSRAAGA